MSRTARDAIAFIQPDRVLTVNIKAAVLASEQALREAGIELSDFVRGNEKARERMKAQYSIAGMTKGVVVGTDHAAEAITGFFTKYGDGGTDINPIFRLNKRQGKQLLAHLGCPEHLYKKLPTADLEDDRPSLPDEVATGCHLREHRRLSGRQNAGPEHRQNDRGLVSENRTQASAADHRL